MCSRSSSDKPPAPHISPLLRKFLLFYTCAYFCHAYVLVLLIFFLFFGLFVLFFSGFFFFVLS